MAGIDSFLHSLYSEPGWDTLAVVLRVLFMVAMAMVLLLLLRPAGGPEKRGVVHPGPVFFFVVFLPFAGVLVYQASWQLIGHTRPSFMKFMQQYDRRQFNPARAINRGRILDRHEKVLAFTYVDAQKRPQRQYPHAGAACHVTGYMDPIYGLAGVEAASNATLVGGRLENAEDWKELGKQWLSGDQEIRGEDVKLSIDIELQRVAWRSMAERPGAVVAMDVRTGQLLVVLSTPTFDPGQLEPDMFTGEDNRAALLNRATHGVYPPGSTFKTLLAAAAVRAGFREPLNCTGDGFTTSVQYPRIKDHEFYERPGAWHGHGALRLDTAMAESCNEFFAQLGVRLGPQALRDMAEGFHFGEQAVLYQGLNGMLRIAPGAGITLRDSDRYGLAQASIGQGRIVASPAHMLLVTAGIANQGRLMKPRLQAGLPPELWSQPLTPTQAAAVAATMRAVVTDGTGRALRDLPFPVAGKTGTAQTPRGNSHAWFTAFAPYGSPRVAICVLVEHGGYGSTSALPVAREVLRKAAELGYLGDG
jgi:penicillin-binding protein A